MNKVARALAVFALVPLLLGASCPTGEKIAVDLAACALGEVPAAVAGLVPEVEAALQGTPADWAREEASLGTAGLNAALCAVKAALAEILRVAGTAAAPPRTLVAVDRANVYLAAHGGE